MDDKISLAYEALRAKQLAFDSLMWQTPVLGVTAESFLLTIAFDSSKGVVATMTSSILAIMLGVASFQLMLKHRYHEMLTNNRLHEIEKENKLIEVHKKPPSAKKLKLLLNMSSFRVWSTALLLTTLGGFIALVMSWFSDEQEAVAYLFEKLVLIGV